MIVVIHKPRRNVMKEVWTAVMTHGIANRDCETSWKWYSRSMGNPSPSSYFFSITDYCRERYIIASCLSAHVGFCEMHISVTLKEHERERER